VLGETLRRLRGIYGYSARELSEVLQISSSYLSEIEHGKKQPSVELLQRYADVFGLRLSTLLRFSENYGYAVNQGKGQQFITKMMGMLIEAYGDGDEATDSD
jgi:transcriptional regulator with XRE-family HTH domain